MKWVKWIIFTFAIGWAAVIGLFIIVNLIDLTADFNKMSKKEVTAASLDYLETKYNEEFSILDISYSRPRGDDHGTFTVEAIPVKQPEISLHIRANERMEEPVDDYIEMKWRRDAKEMLRPVIDKLFPERLGYFVNIGYQPEAAEHLKADTYEQSALPREHNLYLFIYPYRDNLEEHLDEEYKKFYELYQYMNTHPLGEFSIGINYLNTKNQEEEAKRFEYEDLHNQKVIYYFNLDTRTTSHQQALKSVDGPGDMAEFGHFPYKN
ncbi:hypothetical protein [Mesobacillus harenae]|uniref:hypothetical protein n=1 Tax=Mesobacillus harenae TaxID=2213203 RepID=UPI00158117F6|nr:hypothetical protein [Mesobacillus harenae]